jgi:hypothetical protein
MATVCDHLSVEEFGRAVCGMSGRHGLAAFPGDLAIGAGSHCFASIGNNSFRRALNQEPEIMIDGSRKCSHLTGHVGDHAEQWRTPGFQGSAKPQTPSIHDNGMLSDLSIKPLKFQTDPLPPISLTSLARCFTVGPD